MTWWFRKSLGDIADYRVWPEWRVLVLAFLDQLSRSHPYVISPMSVSNRTHWDEITVGVAELGCPLSALILVADELDLIRRIREAPVEKATKTFRVHYLEADLAAFCSSSFGTGHVRQDPLPRYARMLSSSWHLPRRHD